MNSERCIGAATARARSRWHVRAVILASLGIVALSIAVLGRSVWAQQANPSSDNGVVVAVPSGGASLEDTTRLLMEQANFWRSQNQPDKALVSIRRLLDLTPDNADALAMRAEIQVDQGDITGAQASLLRLRTAHPNDPHIAVIEQSLRAGPIDRSQLVEARRLAQLDRKADAVALYQRIFNGAAPPPDLAIEYYLLLSGVDSAGWEKARTELGAMLTANPQNLNLQLAYAKILTYHEATRADGIDRLQQLAGQPGISTRATVAWREALLWQGPDIRTRDQLQTYLHDHPTDPTIDEKMAELKASLPDDGDVARWRGWQAMANHDLATAEREFNAALAIRPDDPDAMIALATLRRQQHRTADADRLISQALALAPDRREDFMVTLGGYAQSTAKANNGADSAIGKEYSQVVRLTKQGNYDQAEQRLRRLMGNHPAAANYVQLGQIQALAGRPADAEASFRQALQANPRSADAAAGLAGVLASEGHQQEADTFYTQAQELYAKAGNRAGLQGLNRSRADQLVHQAGNLEDPVARTQLYRDAVAIDPTDPWIRLQLARLLQQQGQTAEARQVMAEVVAGDHPDPASLQAAIIFAQQTGDLPQANQLIDRLPPNARTPQMAALQQQLAIRTQIQGILQGGNRSAARSQLLALAARPDPTGIRGVEIGHALVRMNDAASVPGALNVALASTQNPTTEQRLAYCGALLEAIRTEDAKAMIAGLDAEALTVQQRTALIGMLDGIAIQRADKLNQQGHPADAYDVLAPRLADDPQNIALNLALSRLYQAHGKASEGLAIDEALLQRDPNNINLRNATAYAAIAAGELRRADQLTTEGLRLHPDDPRAYMASADVAKARGEDGRALRALKTARELRLQQLHAEP